MDEIPVLRILISALGVNVPTPIFPGTFNLVYIVEIPVVENPLLMELTVIFAVVVIEFAVEAIPTTFPVKFPTNPLVAVIMPETLILDGSLEFDRVPDEILSAFMEVILAPDPLKLDAVIIPDALILPVELIPTPDCVLGFEPTWK